MRFSRIDKNVSDSRLPLRCLIISSKMKNVAGIVNSVLPNIVVVSYKYDSATLDNLLATIAEILGNHRVESIAMILNGSSGSINICRIGDKVIAGT